MRSRSRRLLAEIPIVAGFAYLFFLAITLLGSGMKASFKAPLKEYLHVHAADFTELVSFAIGLLGTSLVQSSSTVTSMAVVLTQEGVVPLVIAVGIVHGANLGTSVTSSIVAFASEIRPLSGNPVKDVPALLFKRRLPGFRRAVGTAVIHDLFNILMVTGILLAIELPFGLVRSLSAASAEAIGSVAVAGGPVMDVLVWVSPKTWTAPVFDLLHEGAGLPGWALVLLGFALLFGSIKGFSRRVRGTLMAGTDPDDVETLGQKLLGRTFLDTFARGLVLTILVQSSSATTSMVVPLAAMGFFSVRKVFPFILGANIGTTATALIAASSALGTPGFEAGMTIALSHFYLNSLAVILVVAFPPLRTSILGAADWLATRAERVPAVLLAYLATLVLVTPVLVYFLPTWVASAVLGSLLVVMAVGPHLWLRRRARLPDAVVAPVPVASDEADTAAA